MITPERIVAIDGKLVYGGDNVHDKYCDLSHISECECIYGMARELLSELKDSIAREKKKREEVSRFASKLTGWIEEQIA